MQVPIGAEEEFMGVVDLVGMRALTWRGETTTGEDYEVEEIPAELAEEVAKDRERLIEIVAESMTRSWRSSSTRATSSIEESTRAIPSGPSRKIVPVLAAPPSRTRASRTCSTRVKRYLPSPLDVRPHQGLTRSTTRTRRSCASRVTPSPSPAWPTRSPPTPTSGKLIYVRVYSGKLEAGANVLNSVTGRKERIGKVYQMHANKREEIASVGAGQIVAVMG